MPEVSNAEQAARQRFRDDVSMWLDESVWGHRLYDEQTPWLCFLEFLGVLAHQHREGRAFQENGIEGVEYAMPMRLPLRALLFSNPRLRSIERSDGDDEELWAVWEQSIREATANVRPFEAEDFRHVRRRFGRFHDFAKTVEFLRATAIEEQSNKRWTSKFVFPFGPDCLYADLSATNFYPDRRFFGRSGEMLYLMLCRSGRGEEIRERLAPLVLEPEARWNRVVRALHSTRGARPVSTRTGYLPEGEREEHNDLADDWLCILSLPLPGYDALRHLVAISGLHLVRYLVNRAHEELGGGNRARFVVEIAAPRKTPVRDLSAASFAANNHLSRRAVETRIRAFAASAPWARVRASSTAVDDAFRELKNEFQWRPKRQDTTGITTADDALEVFQRKAAERHKGHLGNVHRVYARHIGLASSRGSQRLRYAPSDALLKTLVLANVHERMEYKAFLACLTDKYGLVIGDREAEPELREGGADGEDFAENATRLERRLLALGHLKRLSDACAYVTNSTGRRHE